MGNSGNSEIRSFLSHVKHHCEYYFCGSHPPSEIAPKNFKPSGSCLRTRAPVVRKPRHHGVVGRSVAGAGPSPDPGWSVPLFVVCFFLKFHLPRSTSPAVNRSCYTFDVISHSFSFPRSDGHSAALPCPRLNEGFANCRRGPNACVGKRAQSPMRVIPYSALASSQNCGRTWRLHIFFWAMWTSQESRLGPLRPDAALLQRRHQPGLARPVLFCRTTCGSMSPWQQCGGVVVCEVVGWPRPSPGHGVWEWGPHIGDTRTNGVPVIGRPRSHTTSHS